MVRSERDQWSGTVEVNETLVGGVGHGGKRGRGAYIDRVIDWFRHLFRLDS